MFHCIIVSNRQRFATELIARHLTEAGIAREARATTTTSWETAEAPEVLVLDHQGLPDPFAFAAAVREHYPRLKLILFVEEPSDYLLWKARRGRFSGLLSASDGMEAWAQAFRTPCDGFYVAPGARPRDGARILGRVTSRQMEVLELTVQGLSDAQIGERLGGLSESTIETHRRDLCSRLDCHSWTELVVLAINAGVVRPSHIRFSRAERRNHRTHSAREAATA